LVRASAHLPSRWQRLPESPKMKNPSRSGPEGFADLSILAQGSSGRNTSAPMRVAPIGRDAPIGPQHEQR
jgi:hypothetical protein